MTKAEWNLVEDELQKYLNDQKIPFFVTCDDWNSTEGHIWFSGVYQTSKSRGIQRRRLWYALQRFTTILFDKKKLYVMFPNPGEHFDDTDTLYNVYFY